MVARIVRHHLSVKSDGLTSRIEVDGMDISHHVRSFVLHHEAGDIARAELRVIEPERISWEGDVQLSIVLKCPLCAKEHTCEHEGNREKAGVVEVTSLAEGAARFTSLTGDA